MKNLTPSLFQSQPFLITLGLLSLGVILAVQAFGLASVASANSRDEFPGRRQGGGTHWVIPSEDRL
ncbi:MAG: hypothetical protein VKI82_12255 [Leptolyngbya sp.]|nr:hypothetical protein [Leptolyngbya sp.]